MILAAIVLLDVSLLTLVVVAAFVWMRRALRLWPA